MDSDVYTLEDLGIELTSSPKAPKRLRRAAAPHQVMLKFTVDHTKTETTPDGTVYYLRHASMDRVFTVMVFNMKTLTPEDVTMVDGMGILKILGILGGKEYNHVKKTVVLPDRRHGQGVRSQLRLLRPGRVRRRPVRDEAGTDDHGRYRLHRLAGHAQGDPGVHGHPESHQHGVL